MTDLLNTRFHFTITSDIHENDIGFRDVCNAINEKAGGPGAFHLSCGDITGNDNDPSIFSSPEPLRDVIDDSFGKNVIWFSAVGNHDITDSEGGGIQWIRNEYTNANGSTDRDAWSTFVTGGPSGTTETMFWWDYENIRIVVINQYWDGSEASPSSFPDEALLNGTIVDETIDWLTGVFSSAVSLGKQIFVFGHEPAFNNNSKINDGLDRDKVQRNKFWELLEDYGVIIHITGDSHIISSEVINSKNITGEGSWSHEERWNRKNNVWESEVGHAGRDNFSTGYSFLDITVTEKFVTFDMWRDNKVGSNHTGGTWSKSDSWTVFTGEDEYGDIPGGKWYYTHNKFGTKWFNNVNNKTGWTVDFNLQVTDVANSDIVIDEDENRGIGLYVNDGEKKETITFLPQEILLANSNEKIVYDTSVETNYRLTGKEDSLNLYAFQEGDSSFSNIAKSYFSQGGNNSGNGLKPSIYEESDGTIHATWYDDGNGSGQIYYSKFENAQWSQSELVISDVKGSLFPSILVDNEGLIYISYETQKTPYSIIGMVYKNNIGWSNPYFTGIENGNAKSPQLTFDSKFNVVIVWEDSRQSHPEIYLNKFIKSLQKWDGERKISDTDNGAYKPSITSYLDNIFISWTKKNDENNSTIEVVKYNALSSSLSSYVELTNFEGWADSSCILANVSSKIFVTWHDNATGSSEIYLIVLNPDLDILQSTTQITNSNGGAKYPVLSEQSTTGNIYIVWHDYTTSYTQFIPLDEYTDDPYFLSPYEEIEPLTFNIYLAVYINLGDTIYSNNSGSFNIDFSFSDERNAQFPSVPLSFNQELPIVYESKIKDNEKFIINSGLFTQIRNLFYNLSRSLETFIINYDNAQRDFILNSIDNHKEIRFGDFSDTLNSHIVFKNFKYYTKGAIPPFQLKEISSNNFTITSLTATDIEINNYGDVWIVGTCGVLFYIDRNGELAMVGPDEDLEGLMGIEETEENKKEETNTLKTFRSIAFDAHGYMFIGGDNGIRYSIEHIKGFYKIEGFEGVVNSLTFDKNNNLLVGTNNGIKIYETVEKDGKISIGNNIIEDISGQPGEINSLSGYITSIKIDDNNIAWIGTYNGLYRFFKNTFMRFDIDNDLPSNRVNDIAIRNTAIRYVATSSGIAKMLGNIIDEIITSENENIWNNNVKSVIWQNPNILWAGTLSKINQITVDDSENTYSTLVYEPALQFDVQNNDLKTYYILSEDETIDETDILDIYVNGTLIHHGYDLGIDTSVSPFQRIIQFKTNMQNDDVVEVVVRKDIRKIQSFIQSTDEKKAIGEKIIRIKEVFTAEDLIYASTEGEEQEIKVNDGKNILPFDKIYLDTVPPIGNISLTSNPQVDRNVVRVNIVATDIDSQGLDGSGVDKMIISNFSNFTTDGETSQQSVPYQRIANHKIGDNVEEISTQFIFENGQGSVIQYFPDINKLYASTSQPAILYSFNWEDNLWEEEFSYGEDNYVDFITSYNNQIIVGVGHPTSIARLFSYNFVFENGFFSGLNSSAIIRSLSESRSFCSHNLNNLLYIGSGIGSGSEYMDGSGESGSIYVYSDNDFQKIISNLDSNVYSLTSVNNSNNLLAATGENGFIYEIDIDKVTSSIIHNDVESIASIQYILYNNNDMIFTGGDNKGIVRRSFVGNNSFDISFRTIPSRVNTFDINIENNINILYAVVGKTIYYLSESGTWIWKYVHREEINDITFDNGNINDNNLYVISRTGITQIRQPSSSKNIYLKLIDKAGNETSLTASGDLTPEGNPLITSVNISDLENFANENQIFKIDEFGEKTTILDDISKYYSASEIEAEKGVYVSEIFNGTNDLIKWESASWQVTEPNNTSVLFYVRSSNSSNDILTEEWIGPYSSSQSAEINISHLDGTFVQFMVELFSEEKGISPSLHQVNIRAVASESVHFFTTNFVIPSSINKGIITSRKVVPVSADIVFGINTTNSVDWSEYQQVDENRIFNVNQLGQNCRVGIKLISPNRPSHEPIDFEYGPYNLDLHVNTIDFTFLNSSGTNNNYHFRITLYEDVGLINPIYSTYSLDSVDGFSVDGQALPSGGFPIDANDEVRVLLTIPGNPAILCDHFYFVFIESVYDNTTEVVSDDTSFVSSCSTSFVDNIDFDFMNTDISSNFHFRIKFFNNPERTDEYLTIYSGNNRSGWFVDDSLISEDGASVGLNQTVNIVYRSNPEDFEINNIYYLEIMSYNTNTEEWSLSSNSYTFQIRDVRSLEYCGGYIDVPIVKNFSIMIELSNNEFVTFNI